MADTCAHALVFKFYVQPMAEELQIDEFPYPNRQWRVKRKIMAHHSLLPSLYI